MGKPGIMFLKTFENIFRIAFIKRTVLYALQYVNEESHKQKCPEKTSGHFADRTGLEPATSAVTGQHSNQLNYRSNIFFSKKLYSLPLFYSRGANIHSFSIFLNSILKF